MNNTLPNNVLAFTNNDAERNTGYSKFIEYFNTYKAGKQYNDKNVSFEEMDGKMRTFFSDEIERISGKKQSDYGDLKVYCNFTDVREAAFTVIGLITDLIIPDTLIKDLGAIAEIKNGAWGDSLKIELKPRDLFVVSKGGRARRDYDVTRQFKGEKTLIAEPHGISVGISLYDVLRGAYSLAEFTSKAVLSIETNMKYDIYDSFAKAMSELPDTAGAGQLRISGWNQDGAIELAQKVEAWNGNTKAVFMGTKLALSKILPASTDTRILLGDEYVKIGYMREFMGFTTVELDQIADYTTEFAVKLDNKKIYILCPGTDKIVKVFVEGSTLSHVDGEYENANLQQTATLIKSYAVAAVSSAIAGVIELA